MREEVPASRAVAVVVEPGAEDEVCCDAEEEAGSRLVYQHYEERREGLTL